jgi:hypothetical protein
VIKLEIFRKTASANRKRRNCSTPTSNTRPRPGKMSEQKSSGGNASDDTNHGAQRTVPSAPPFESGSANHCFLTHTWQKDEEGRPTHDRVARVHAGLRDRGVQSWFDEESMRGDVVDQMVAGIETSAVIVVFITKKYIDKVASGNASDNCRREFMYADRKKTASRMIPVPMERCVADPNQWNGPVGMTLGGLLYEASFMTDDEASFNRNLDMLAGQILRKCEEVDSPLPMAVATPLLCLKQHPLVPLHNWGGRWPYYDCDGGCGQRFLKEDHGKTCMHHCETCNWGSCPSCVNLNLTCKQGHPLVPTSDWATKHPDWPCYICDGPCGMKYQPETCMRHCETCNWGVCHGCALAMGAKK